MKQASNKLTVNDHGLRKRTAVGAVSNVQGNGVSVSMNGEREVAKAKLRPNGKSEEEKAAALLYRAWEITYKNHRPAKTRQPRD
jgi:hypothetical protein